MLRSTLAFCSSGFKFTVALVFSIPNSLSLPNRNFRNKSAGIGSVVDVTRFELPAFEYSNENALRARSLFHGDGLREIPRLIHIAAAAHGDVIRKKL